MSGNGNEKIKNNYTILVISLEFNCLSIVNVSVVICKNAIGINEIKKLVKCLKGKGRKRKSNL